MLLGLDLGTTNVKALVTDSKGRRLGEGSRAVQLFHVGNGGAEVGKHLAEPILSLQQAFDAARLCDDVVVAAVPAG